MNILNLDPFVDTNEALEKPFGYWGWKAKERFEFKLESIDSSGHSHGNRCSHLERS